VVAAHAAIVAQNAETISVEPSNPDLRFDEPAGRAVWPMA
jgi:hypothetical protein